MRRDEREVLQFAIARAELHQAALELALAAQALGDVVSEHQTRRAAVELQFFGRNLDINEFTTLLLMAPESKGFAGSHAVLIALERLQIARGTDVPHRHRQPLLARVAVVLERGLI